MTLPGFAKGLAFRNSKPSYRRPNLLAPFVRFWWTGTTNMETTVGWMSFLVLKTSGPSFFSDVLGILFNFTPMELYLSRLCLPTTWSGVVFLDQRDRKMILLRTGSKGQLEAKTLDLWADSSSPFYSDELLGLRKSGWNNTYCIHAHLVSMDP